MEIACRLKVSSTISTLQFRTLCLIWMPIIGVDLILCTSWLAILGPHIADYNSFYIQFVVDKQLITLKGDKNL